MFCISVYENVIYVILQAAPFVILCYKRQRLTVKSVPLNAINVLIVMRNVCSEFALHVNNAC